MNTQVYVTTALSSHELMPGLALYTQPAAASLQCMDHQIVTKTETLFVFSGMQYMVCA